MAPRGRASGETDSSKWVANIPPAISILVLEVLVAGHGERRLPITVRRRACSEAGREEVRPPAPSRALGGWIAPLEADTPAQGPGCLLNQGLVWVDYNPNVLTKNTAI